MNKARACLVGFVFLLGLLLTSTHQAAAQDPTPEQPVSTAVNSTGSVVVRIYYQDQARLDDLGSRLDIWSLEQTKGYVIAEIPVELIDQLTKEGYKVEIDSEKTLKINTPSSLDARYFYFDNYLINPNNNYMVNFMQTMSTNYPNLTEMIDIGAAWQAGHGGHVRKMWVLRVTNEDPAYGPIADKPAFFIMAGIHAREVATPELAIRYIKYLITGYNGQGGYGNDADATWLVNQEVLYVMIDQNPDGHYINEADPSAYRRKNMNSLNGCTDPANLGVDLNRNHTFLWGCCGGSSGSACDETYRGSTAGSEPETQAFQSFFASVMKDQNGPNGDTTIAAASPITTTGVFLSLHSYSDVVLWPWGFSNYGAPPNDAQFSAIGRKIGYLTGYSPDGYIGYATDGSSDVWTYGKLGIASFTIEVGASTGICGDFFPSYDCLDGTNGSPRNFWAESKPGLLYYHKIARTPYQTVYGPDAQNLVVTPGAAGPEIPVTLQATLADHRYAGDALTPVAGGEYFIDNPGEDGTGLPMLPADGAWGGTSESAVAIVQTNGLSAGRHYLLVHGKSSTNKWGPFTAIFLYMTEAGVSPVFEGFVRDAGSNAPLAATVKAGMFQGSSETGSGYYSFPVISGTYTLAASADGYVTASANALSAQNYQTIRQDFYLAPTCTIFNDTAETGNPGWSTQYPWAITNEASHSPSHSWTDSPGGNYSNNANISLTSPVFNLTGFQGVFLSFWHKYSTEPGYDYAYVEYSLNGGSTWITTKTYNGSLPGWIQENLALPALDNHNNVMIRFRLKSDAAFVYDGWHLDDITLSGGGPGCFTPTAPVADFTAPARISTGQAFRFLDLTTGTAPLNYHWDFGDGSQLSGDSNPTHTYLQPGLFQVTMTVTNSLGLSQASHPIFIDPGSPLSITQVTLIQVTPGPLMIGQTGTFSADILPDLAHKPFTYTVQYGDGTGSGLQQGSAGSLSLEHAYDQAGDYHLVVSAWNLANTHPVSATLQVQVFDVCIPLQSIQLTLVTTGTIYPNQSVQFRAEISPVLASLPYSYTVNFGDNGPSASGDSSSLILPFSHSFSLAKPYSVQMSASNCGLITRHVSVDVQVSPWKTIIYLPSISRETTVNLMETPTPLDQPNPLIDILQKLFPGWMK